MNETITITKAEYLNLRKDSLKLTMLENGGVDNWEWYCAALNPGDGEKSYSDSVDILKLEVLNK